jgi:dienelactone hydrolase
MRLLLAIFSACLGAYAQIPAQDARNVNLPNTDTHFIARTYKTLAEWQGRKEFLRQQILAAAGLLPLFPKNDLHPQIFGRIAYQDYSIEKVLLETLPGYYLGGNLYRPLKPAPPGGFPAVASPHGHWTNGRLEDTAICSVPARAINLARQGYVVLAYDMVGYNDSVQTPHDFGEKPVEQLWGFGSFGLQLWNSIRAIDFLQSLPGVNPNMIGVTGASGGATQTYTLTAVDDRVQFSAPANMVSFIMQGGGVCENAPSLRLDTNNVEFAAMMAPRPMFMAAATGDWTRNMLKEEYPAVRAIYDLYGKGGNVEALLLDAPHNYNQANREAMYAFFGKHVLDEKDPAKLKERPFRVPKITDMLALFNRTLPANALNYQQLFDEWVRLAKEQNANPRERLAYALAADWPSEVLSQVDGGRILLGRPGKGDRIPGIWVKGSNPPVLVVHPDGAEAARRTPEVARLVEAGRAVLMIDAFQTGSAVAPRDRSVRNFLTFNKSDDANRVQDILTALAWLNTRLADDKKRSSAPLRLIGLGKAAVWCLFAAAVSRQPVDLQADLGGFTGADQDYIDSFFVPGIQRAGGLRAARQLVGAAPPAAELWRFDRIDQIGGHKTTVLGHPRVIDSPVGKAVEFNGVDDALFVDVHPLAGAETFTWEIVFRPDPGGAPEQRFFHMQEKDLKTGEDTATRMLSEIRVVDGRWCLDSFATAGGQSRALLNRERLHPLGAWYSVAMVYDGHELRNYVDGVLEGAGDLHLIPQGPGHSSIGVRINKVNYFKGAVALARMTRAALPPAEFLKLPGQLSLGAQR